MNRNLLIIGAGIYGIVAKEIAESMNCFEKIDFVDDNEKSTPDGISVIEPMAVIHTDVVISVGCIISAGAVVNHASMCCDGVHVDCNATVAGNTVVPAGTKVKSGEVYEGKKQPHPLLPIDGKTYSFDDVM